VRGNCRDPARPPDLALGLEDKGSAASRGWFRIEPGQCRIVLQDAIEAEHLNVHARALALYGSSPPSQAAHADLCVADGNFVIAGARSCVARKGQRLVDFTAIAPSQSEQGLTANIAEQADYSEDQARLAGIQRLLVAAGYDANPIDGVPGKKTDAALARFLKDRGLAAEAATQPGFFDALVAAVQQSAGAKFSWCNAGSRQTAPRPSRHAQQASQAVRERALGLALGLSNGRPVTLGLRRLRPARQSTCSPMATRPMATAQHRSMDQTTYANRSGDVCVRVRRAETGL
jgi:uncharacterized membrane protein